MKNDKLKFLLTQVDNTDLTEEDELISLNDELAENLVDLNGAINGICAGNGLCIANGVCYGNPSCVGPNGVCVIDISDPEPIDIG